MDFVGRVFSLFHDFLLRAASIIVHLIGRHGDNRLLSGESSSTGQTEPNTEPTILAAENASTIRTDHSQNLPSPVSNTLGDATDSAVKDVCVSESPVHKSETPVHVSETPVRVSEALVQNTSASNGTEDGPVSEDVAGTVMHCVKRSVVISRGCQTEAQLTCTDCRATIGISLSRGHEIVIPPEQTAVPPFLDRNPPGSGASEEEGGLPEAAAETSPGDSANPAAESDVGLEASACITEDDSATSGSNQHSNDENASEMDPDSDSDDRGNAVVDLTDRLSICIERTLDVLSPTHTPSQASNTREDAAISASHEESYIALDGEASPDPHNGATSPQTAESYDHNPDASLQTAGGQQSVAERPEDQESPDGLQLRDRSTGSNRGVPVEARPPGTNESEADTAEDTRALQREEEIHEAGHFISSTAYHPPLLNTVRRVGTMRARMSRPARRLQTPVASRSPPSLFVLAAQTMCRNMTPDNLQSLVSSVRQPMMLRLPRPQSLPTPPAYITNPPQYVETPNEPPPAYSLLDPLVASTEILVTRGSQADRLGSEEQPVPRPSVENEPPVDSTGSPLQSERNARTEPQFPLNEEEEPHPHLNEREGESRPSVEGTTLISARQTFSSEAIYSAIRGHRVSAPPAKHRVAGSEQTGAFKNSNSLSPPKRRCGRKGARKSSSDDAEDFGASQERFPGYSRQNSGQTSQRRQRPQSTGHGDQTDTVFPIPFLNGPAFGRTFEEHRDHVLRRFGIERPAALARSSGPQTEAGHQEDGTNATDSDIS